MLVRIDFQTTPHLRLISSSLKLTSSPSNSLASSVASQQIAWAGHSGGMWADGSSSETGFMPDALMFTCMSVATVPGDKPTTRMPFGAYSICAALVSIRAAALDEQ